MDIQRGWAIIGRVIFLLLATPSSAPLASSSLHKLPIFSATAHFMNLAHLANFFPQKKFVSQITGLGLGILAAGWFPTVALPATAQPTVSLPVEVMGENGTVVSVDLRVRGTRTNEVKSLWMRIHGLEYPDMVSVQVNSSAWFSLNNESTAVAEPGKSYGGIGGGFATLAMTLPLPAGTVQVGNNTVRFRFNRSNGAVSGFRVLALNLVRTDGQMICPPDAFMQEEPNTWVAPLPDAHDVAEGEALWRTGRLRSSNLPDAHPIHAHCADCHAQDGRDLKYFNYSNGSIIARSRFHGLSPLEGRQIASYIRSLPFPNPGRPWNPPYQPGPGLDAQPVSHWAAGAGLQWVLNRDEETLPFLFNQAQHPAAALAITPEVFRPDGDLNPREIPIALQLPDWNHWLPRVHPLDAWPSDFMESDFARTYQENGASGIGLDARSALASFSSQSSAASLANGEITRFFEKWSLQRAKFLKKALAIQSVQPSRELTEKIYATQLWQLTKTWELSQELQLEGRGAESGGADRVWLNTIPAEAAPAAAKILSGPTGMGGSALVNEYFNNCWYELQLLLNDGRHRHRAKEPIDWGISWACFLICRRKAIARNRAELWWRSPEPCSQRTGTLGRKMWNKDGGPTKTLTRLSWSVPHGRLVFEPLPGEIKKAVTEALLEAWLDKNAQYRMAQYFAAKRGQARSKDPSYFGEMSGGRVRGSRPTVCRSRGSSPVDSPTHRVGQKLLRHGRTIQLLNGDGRV